MSASEAMTVEEAILGHAKAELEAAARQGHTILEFNLFRDSLFSNMIDLTAIAVQNGYENGNDYLRYIGVELNNDGHLIVPQTEISPNDNQVQNAQVVPPEHIQIAPPAAADYNPLDALQNLVDGIDVAPGPIPENRVTIQEMEAATRIHNVLLNNPIITINITITFVYQ